MNVQHRTSNVDALVKSRKLSFFVIPAKAGIQYFRAFAEYLDSGLRRNDDFLRDCQRPTSNENLNSSKMENWD